MRLPAPVKDFSDNLDQLIRQEYSGFDVFSLTEYMDHIYPVEVVCGAADEGYLYFILKISSKKAGQIFYCRIKNGDGGMIIYRSRFYKKIDPLLKRNLEWGYF